MEEIKEKKLKEDKEKEMNQKSGAKNLLKK